MAYRPVDFTVSEDLVKRIMRMYTLKPIESKREFEMVARNLFDQYLSSEQHKLILCKGKYEQELEEFRRISVQHLGNELLEMLVDELRIKQIDSLI